MQPSELDAVDVLKADNNCVHMIRIHPSVLKGIDDGVGRDCWAGLGGTGGVEAAALSQLRCYMLSDRWHLRHCCQGRYEQAASINAPGLRG